MSSVSIRKCKRLDCDFPPVMMVRGGLKSQEIPVRRGAVWMGWEGAYCMKHGIECVDVQSFQVPKGMPIIMEPMES